MGIVGETGSGKSSFVQLLGRINESDDAQIHINDLPLIQIDQSALRRLLAFVPQESFLFSTNIADNIALGNPAATAAEIKAAAEMAVVADDIDRFPRGYHTPVGEKGITLSGGQKQRIAIARVMLTAAPIVVLDDALSAVDVSTEQKILRNLKQARQDRTTIIVSHRLAAVEHADEVIVLRKGTVLERGTHQELLAKDGWYADMYRYQQLQQAVEEGR